jgi:hypothetical protein
MKLKLRERCALKDAANRPGGWGLFKKSSTEALARRGFFERAKHPAYGEQWRITDAGRQALANSEASAVSGDRTDADADSVAR